MDGKTPRKSWKRRVFRTLAVGFVLTVAAVVAVPWAVGLPPVRRALVAKVNQVLAPSKVAVAGVSASWVHPTRLTGLTLKNAKGKTLIEARQAVVEHSLMSLLMSPHRIGTIVLEGAKVDIERRADGSIDLVDALMPPSPSPNPPKKAAEPSSAPGLSVSLRVLGGSLRLTTPELAEPLVAAKLDMEASLPDEEEGQGISWRVRLAGPPGGAGGETLGVDGSYDHRAATDPDLSLAVKGERWPLAVNGASLGANATVKARLDGLLTIDRKKGKWQTAGDARLLDVDAQGPVLAGDRLQLDKVAGVWDLAQSAKGWDLHKLDLKSPVFQANGGGSIGDAGKAASAHVEAAVDLAALAKQAPHAVHLREGLTLERGSARFTASVATEGAVQTAALDARLSDLEAKDATHAFTMKDPMTVSAKGARTATGFRVDALAVKAAFADLNGSGDLEKGVNVSGRLDLGAFQKQFRELIDFGAVELAGQGRLAADYKKGEKGFVARAAVEVRGLKVAGVLAEPVVRETARADAVLGGTFDASGLPNGWQGVRLNLKSPRDALTLAATRNDAGLVSMSATASTPWTVNQREAQVDARVVGRWAPGATHAADVFEFDELRLGLKPTDPALAADGALALAVRGKVDLGAENVTLTPLPVPAGAAVSLAPEGATIHGLTKTPAADRSARILLKGDAGALDRAAAVWMSQPPYGLAGAFTSEVALRPDGPGRLAFGVSVLSPDLSRPAPDGKGRQPEGPFTTAVRGTYESAADRLTVDEAVVMTRYAVLTAKGPVDEATGRRVADLQGNLIPNWQTLTKLAAGMLEPNTKLEGGPRPFHLKGPLWGGSLAATLKGLDAEVGLNLASADAFGLRLGPAPLVIRCGGGNVTIDPVHSTLNGGTVDLLPGLDVDDVRGIALRLAKGSTIANATINDEVSRRVLRYVAPVLDKATHVNGKVTVAIDDGDIPFTGPPDHKVSLTGQLVFQDVVFAPGPFANELLTLTGQPNSPGLRLHQPVQLSILNGRVRQNGLEIPLRKDVTVALDGSVGFDQTLDLRAGVPLTKGMIGPVPGLEGLMDGRRVVVPIGGTVEHPKINRQALQVALRALSKDVLKREMKDQAGGLLDQLAPGALGRDGKPGAAGESADPVKSIEGELLRRLSPPGRRRP